MNLCPEAGVVPINQDDLSRRSPKRVLKEDVGVDEGLRYIVEVGESIPRPHEIVADPSVALPIMHGRIGVHPTERLPLGADGEGG